MEKMIKDDLTKLVDPYLDNYKSGLEEPVLQLLLDLHYHLNEEMSYEFALSFTRNSVNIDLTKYFHLLPRTDELVVEWMRGLGHADPDRDYAMEAEALQMKYIARACSEDNYDVERFAEEVGFEPASYSKGKEWYLTEIKRMVVRNREINLLEK